MWLDNMLIVHIPLRWRQDIRAELIYTLEYILSRRLGLEWQWANAELVDAVPSLSLTNSDRPGELRTGGDFFAKLSSHFLSEKNLPNTCGALDLARTIFEQCPALPGPLPLLFPNAEGLVADEYKVILPFDVFGAIFFQLSRYEEVVQSIEDTHGRFPYSSSLAYRCELIDRPLIDEYIFIIRRAITHLWPDLELKFEEPCITVSCDVDVPYTPQVSSLKGTLKLMAGDIIKRRSILRALQSGLNWAFSKMSIYQFDSCDSFDFIMRENEKRGNRVVFYFISEDSIDGMNGQYQIGEKRIRRLMRQIHKRGHVIGIHGGYGTYQDQEQFARELENLKNVLAEESIDQPHIPSRQHYLRWDAKTTPSIHAKSNILCDSSLSYAEHAGFRAGTSHAFPLYDLIERRKLEVEEQPLIVMEASVIENSYMGLGESEAAARYMKALKETCFRFGGTYTLLWHNDALQTKASRRIYLGLL